jgi:hypothetical protein
MFKLANELDLLEIIHNYDFLIHHNARFSGGTVAPSAETDCQRILGQSAFTLESQNAH